MDYPLARGVRVLQTDPSGLVAFEKPEGVLSHPNVTSGHLKALLTCAYDFETEAYHWQDQRLWLLHRLDSPTSGVILASSDEHLARVVKAAFRDGGVRKTYHALVFDTPHTSQATWRDRLEKRGSNSVVTKGPVNAITEMHTLGSKRLPDGVVSHLELRPQTGKTHQLRVQCAARGTPIIGDGTYGDFASNRAFARIMGLKRLFLHAFEVHLELVWQGATLEFHARSDLPNEFSNFA
jgi:tRNA pseudouridine65 synthase